MRLHIPHICKIFFLAVFWLHLVVFLLHLVEFWLYLVAFWLYLVELWLYLVVLWLYFVAFWWQFGVGVIKILTPRTYTPKHHSQTSSKGAGNLCRHSSLHYSIVDKSKWNHGWKNPISRIKTLHFWWLYHKALRQILNANLLVNQTKPLITIIAFATIDWSINACV